MSAVVTRAPNRSPAPRLWRMLQPGGEEPARLRPYRSLLGDPPPPSASSAAAAAAAPLLAAGAELAAFGVSAQGGALEAREELLARGEVRDRAHARGGDGRPAALAEPLRWAIWGT